MTCTFFGHREVNRDISSILNEVLTDLIINHDVKLFYVGDKGEFDHIVRIKLKELKAVFPHINYAVVLSSIPGKTVRQTTNDYVDTIFPEELENSPPRFAIDKRNHWMLNKADYVVCYVNSSIGGAAKFYELAVKKHKYVINIGSARKNS